MGVNHFLLAINDEELATVLRTPEEVRGLVERRAGEVHGLGTGGVAIVALTGADDPLAFLHAGASDGVSGWVGRYVEEGGQVVECEVDMGYGPASYYRNGFLQKVAHKLAAISSEVFAARYDPDWLEKHCVYPCGWDGPGRNEWLIKAYCRYRTSVVAAAESGQHLLVWCA